MRRKELKRKIHDGLIKATFAIAFVVFALGALSMGAEGKALATALIACVISGAYIGLVTWANVSLGNW